MKAYCNKCKKQCTTKFVQTAGEWHSKRDMLEEAKKELLLEQNFINKESVIKVPIVLSKVSLIDSDYYKQLDKGEKENKKTTIVLEQRSTCCNAEVEWRIK